MPSGMARSPILELNRIGSEESVETVDAGDPWPMAMGHGHIGPLLGKHIGNTLENCRHFVCHFYGKYV